MVRDKSQHGELKFANQQTKIKTCFFFGNIPPISAYQHADTNNKIVFAFWHRDPRWLLLLSDPKCWTYTPGTCHNRGYHKIHHFQAQSLSQLSLVEHLASLFRIIILHFLHTCRFWSASNYLEWSRRCQRLPHWRQCASNKFTQIRGYHKVSAWFLFDPQLNQARHFVGVHRSSKARQCHPRPLEVSHPSPAPPVFVSPWKCSADATWHRLAIGWAVNKTASG